MNTDGISLRLKQLIDTKAVFSICLPPNPTLDSIAAATALYLGLSKLGKTASLASDTQLSGQYDLVAVDKFQNSLSSQGDNLVVSFPYSEGAIDKVTYNIEGESFNLVIQPKEGYEKLDSSQVSYKYTGGKVDAVFVLDAPTLESLGSLYEESAESFKGVDLVNIDRHLTNTSFGTINIVEKQSASLSELVYQLFSTIGVDIDQDIATNLFAGIVAATNNFTAYSVNAETFEASAALLKKGAVKKPQRAGQSLTQESYQPQASSTFSAPQPVRQAEPVSAAVSPAQSPPPAAQNTTVVEEAGSFQMEAVENKEAQRPQKPPKDWLRPKIFKGGGGLV